MLEARVLGVLIEKSHTVPDSYPLSLNALVSGCNQKTARDPVLGATDAEVQVAADALKALNLVFESSGSRVSRYEHNMGRVMALPSQSVALLALLCLRGPQTSAELRANTERLHHFADVSAAEGFLEELADRSVEKGGPLVVKMARAPGSREARWMHLLCGAVDVGLAASNVAPEDFVAASELAALKQGQDRLTREVFELRDLVERLYTELGVNR